MSFKPVKPSPSLFSLPTELVQDIVHLLDRSSQSHFLLTCSHLYSVCHPAVYSVLDLNRYLSYSLPGVPPSFLHDFVGPHGKWVRHLSVMIYSRWLRQEDDSEKAEERYRPVLESLKYFTGLRKLQIRTERERTLSCDDAIRFLEVCQGVVCDRGWTELEEVHLNTTWAGFFHGNLNQLFDAGRNLFRSMGQPRFSKPLLESSSTVERGNNGYDSDRDSAGPCCPRLATVRIINWLDLRDCDDDTDEEDSDQSASISASSRSLSSSSPIQTLPSNLDHGLYLPPTVTRLTIILSELPSNLRTLLKGCGRSLEFLHIERPMNVGAKHMESWFMHEDMDGNGGTNMDKDGSNDTIGFGLKIRELRLVNLILWPPAENSISVHWNLPHLHTLHLEDDRSFDPTTSAFIHALYLCSHSAPVENISILANGTMTKEALGLLGGFLDDSHKLEWQTLRLRKLVCWEYEMGFEERMPMLEGNIKNMMKEVFFKRGLLGRRAEIAWKIDKIKGMPKIVMEC